MTTEQLREIKKFNENIDWLKGSQTATISTDYVDMKEAMKILGRQRTWIQTRMVKEVSPGMNTAEILVRDADWIREGNRLMFKRDSLVRLKRDVLQAIGNKYDNI